MCRFHAPVVQDRSKKRQSGISHGDPSQERDAETHTFRHPHVLRGPWIRPQVDRAPRAPRRRGEARAQFPRKRRPCPPFTSCLRSSVAFLALLREDFISNFQLIYLPLMPPSTCRTRPGLPCDTKMVFPVI